jgi:hypothetical protein
VQEAKVHNALWSQLRKNPDISFFFSLHVSKSDGHKTETKHLWHYTAKELFETCVIQVSRRHNNNFISIITLPTETDINFNL